MTERTPERKKREIERLLDTEGEKNICVTCTQEFLICAQKFVHTNESLGCFFFVVVTQLGIVFDEQCFHTVVNPHKLFIVKGFVILAFLLSLSPHSDLHSHTS